MASKVEIANRALQLMGDSSITALTEDSRRARTLNLAYDPVRMAELRAHPWAFAVSRAQLAASATAPDFGPANAFPVPSDFLRLLPPDSYQNSIDRDWKVEGRSILTNDSAPLNVRYIADVDDPNTMDALFREAFAHRLAMECCEQLTQSNTKLAAITAAYKAIIREARRTSAFDSVPLVAADDDWITARL